MFPDLSPYYSGSGPLGALTPVVAIVLNVIGIALGILLTKLIKVVLSPRYDLDSIPSPPVGNPILGHVNHLLRTDYHRVLLGWANKYGSIFKFRVLMDWTVVVTDPAAAASVLHHIPGRTHNYQLVDEILGGVGVHSMFGTADEAHWRNVRKATAPAFSMANVRRYYGGFLGSAGELLSRLDREQGALGRVDVEPHLQRLMLRATLEGLFEVPDATRVPHFDRLAPNVLLLMAEANAQMTDPLRAWWYRTPLAPRTSRHFARCRRALREVVAFHTNTAARLLARPDPSDDNTLLWACLHRLRHHRTGRKMTPQQLHPEVGMYTTAGFDTTSSTVGWCLYAAALHPERQEAVARELRQAGVFGAGAVVEGHQHQQGEIEPEGGAAASAGGGGGGGGASLRLVGGRCPSPEDLARLPQLNAFISEVMRLYPATAVSAERRSPDRPVRVMGHVLPPGVTVWALTYGIHMADSNWEAPEEFRPERWLEDPRCSFARPGPANSANPSAAPAVVADAAADAVEGADEAEQRLEAEGGSGGSTTAVRRFLPFGEGPKNCVGQNFGLTVVRAVVALLLSRYRVALHPDMMAAPAPQQQQQQPGAGRAAAQAGAAAAAARLVPHPPPLQPDTGALTQVAVTTKLKRLRLVLERRD